MLMLGDVGESFEAQGQLLVAGGETPVLFVQVDAALDGVPLAVDVGVEPWGPPTA
jgi:hypothetical protein